MVRPIIVGVYINATHYQDCQEMVPGRLNLWGNFTIWFFLIGNSFWSSVFGPAIYSDAGETAEVWLELKVWSWDENGWCFEWSTSWMFQVTITLLNGNPELLTLPPSSTVQDVRIQAQRAFGKKYLKLVTAKNRVLVNFEQTLEEAEIEDGECLTALVLQPQLAATLATVVGGAFALWCHGDSVIVTWGGAGFGGHSSAVRDQLKGVQQIQATVYLANEMILR